MILEAFGGPGGWSEGLKALGGTDLAFEIERFACETRWAAGHATMQYDVTQVCLDPFKGRVVGLIASPPCQDFSNTGLRLGLKGARGKLVHEVIRWADQLRPEWIACEQVPQVLPLWQNFARELESWGYRTWTGVLNTADFGVPQVRKRAVLMASSDEPPKPWITMAEGLGWGYTDEPSNTLCSSSGDGGPHRLDGGSGAREKIRRAQRDGSWKLHTNRGQEPDGSRQVCSIDRPAPSLTGKSGQQWKLVPDNAAAWAFTRPATTIMGDPRVFQPGEQSENAISMTIRDALLLQGFRPDYPVQGTQTSQFQQIGNAIPPPLASAILRELL